MAEKSRLEQGRYMGGGEPDEETHAIINPEIKKRTLAKGSDLSREKEAMEDALVEGIDNDQSEEALEAAMAAHDAQHEASDEEIKADKLKAMGINEPAEKGAEEETEEPSSKEVPALADDDKLPKRIGSRKDAATDPLRSKSLNLRARQDKDKSSYHVRKKREHKKQSPDSQAA